VPLNLSHQLSVHILSLVYPQPQATRLSTPSLFHNTGNQQTYHFNIAARQSVSDLNVDLSIQPTPRQLLKSLFVTVVRELIQATLVLYTLWL
jgi:hypothetical protein